MSIWRPSRTNEPRRPHDSAVPSDGCAAASPLRDASRLEAFSDGVIAIIVTIMVLEMKAPQEPSPASLWKVIPLFVCYGFSFLVAAIMWVNHHSMMNLADHVSAATLWANNNLLFWMSLIPFATAYLGHNPTAPLAVCLYGGVMAMCGLSFTLVREVVIREHPQPPAREAHNRRIFRKNLLSSLLYLASAPIAFVSIYISFFIFVLIPAIYFIPERRVEVAAG